MKHCSILFHFVVALLFVEHCFNFTKLIAKESQYIFVIANYHWVLK